MNAVPDSIIVNSCQYTPVYLIQDPGASQGQSYIIAQSNVEDPKPISDNLKSFYESSGNIENGVVNVNTSSKPRILKKQDCVVGNNLKLASFLLPKNENSSKQQYVLNSVVMKPNPTLASTHVTNNTPVVSTPLPATATVTTASTLNTVPRLNMDSKIVKLRDTTFNGTTLKTIDGRRYNRVDKTSPKIKPKEIPPILQGAPTKHTSVQLLKLGETYHSLNQLSDDQMKMVTQALKIFSNPEKIAPEPAYDPVTNTKFIYKVVSPKDLTVVGKNKIITKERKQLLEPNIDQTDIKKEQLVKTEPRKEFIRDILKKENAVNDLIKKDIVKEAIRKYEIRKDVRKNDEKIRLKIKREMEEEQELAESFVEINQPKVTRSGRKVKLPKLSLPEGTCHKPKKKSTYVSCFQCATEFPSLYRLQKHYESHPTHIPAKIHSNLFHCLLAVVKSGADGDRTNIFIQQLEQLIVKLRSLLPCLLSADGEGKPCSITEHVARLLGINPGKYYFDVEALSCEKNKDGYCKHSPPPSQHKDLNQEQNGHVPWLNEEDMPATPEDTEDCARINSVEKWPTVSKRVWKQKQQRSQENAKRMRLASENCDILIELGMDDLAILDKPAECPEDHSAIIEQGAENKADNLVVKVERNGVLKQEVRADIVEPEVKNTSTIEELVDTQPASLPLDAPQAQTTEEQTNHTMPAKFYSAHFDIRSSPIKPTSTVFRKFQINPALLAKYETQIIRSIETVNKDHDRDKEVARPSGEPASTERDDSHGNKDVVPNGHVGHSPESILNNITTDILPNNQNTSESSLDILHDCRNSRDLIQTAEDILQTCRNLPANENALHSTPDILLADDQQALQTNPHMLCGDKHVLHARPDVLQCNESVLNNQDDIRSSSDVRDVLVNEDTLQGIFRDDDLSAVKESFILDRELKDWILNRSNDKSDDSFSRSTSLIEPALLHVRDDEIKSQLNVSHKVDMPQSVNHDESSVLNFLDTLATDCLSYPGTEIRTNNGDFQLDLFSFHSS